ncbi:hypothetical protein JZO77_03820 [Enterococcus hulanensis]|uniref:transcriptional regulator GutM n=1 Tax=Enterococcus TaxID=1350 RepID=UPI000B5A94F0|nr:MULTISPECIES: transcriptional regulator GutM [Enterococcus]MBO0412075.1 hypothetical protein [Enterococcus hulanensis]MBO0455864.1 hypothetical protein [Enterococcus hulanensis]MDT2660775.1 transcriptional regulator GutM [Enterococcus hulanensis]OTO20250.1 hypothetical protein A5875_001600 [Enterococcus sp. 3H8_DIV0648]
MTTLFLPLFLLFVLNFSFSYLQFVNIKKTIVEIKADQAVNTIVTMGRAKSKYSLRKGALVIISISEENAILAFHEMVGRTIFSRTKSVDSMIGLPLDTAYSQLSQQKDLKAAAFEQALKNCNKDFYILKEVV